MTSLKTRNLVWYFNENLKQEEYEDIQKGLWRTRRHVYTVKKTMFPYMKRNILITPESGVTDRQGV